MKNFIAKMGAVLFVLWAASVSHAGTLKDSRDGKTYKTVQIGDKVWMAENLNYRTRESKCYDNKEKNCDKYSRLYTWEDARDVCPAGWHLPSKEEFETLLENVGGEKTAGAALKTRSGWRGGGNGRDEYGFGALPAGLYYGSLVYFSTKGVNAFFWSSTESSSDVAYDLLLRYDEVAHVNYDGKDNGFSVRCVKNN